MKTFHFLSLKLVSFFFQFKQAVKQARGGQLGRLLVESRWQLPVYQCFNLILSPQFTLSLWWKQVKLLQQVKHLPSNEDFLKKYFVMLSTGIQSGHYYDIAATLLSPWVWSSYQNCVPVEEVVASTSLTISTVAIWAVQETSLLFVLIEGFVGRALIVGV